MTREQQIAQLEGRAKTLEARGSHNNAIVKKIKRKIRQLKSQG